MTDASETMSQEQRAILGERMRALGVAEVAKRLGLSNEAVLRLAVGVTSQAGTEALAVARLGRLGE